MKPSHFKSNKAQSFGDYLLVFSKRIQTNSLFTYINFKILMPVVLAHWMHRSITSTSQLQRFLLINIQDNIFQWISLTIVLNASSKGTFYSMCRRHYFDVRSSFNVWGAVNYPLTLLTNIRTLAFYTPRNNTLGNPPGENSTQKQYFWKSPWEKRNPETILLEIPLGKIQLTRHQFPKIGGADTPQPIKFYSGMVKWKDNFFKLESCAQ